MVHPSEEPEGMKEPNRVDQMTSHLKKIFWLNIFGRDKIERLGILAYAFGLNLVFALDLNQNSFFQDSLLDYTSRRKISLLNSAQQAFDCQK